MKRIIAILLCVLFISGPLQSYAGGTAFHEDPDAVERAALSVLKLTVYDKKGRAYATGSGFVMFDNLTLVTNYHVIEDGYSVTAESDDGYEYDFTKVLVASKQKDIAILRFKTPTVMQPLVPATESLRRAEWVVAIGSPKGQKNTVSFGNVSSLFAEDGVDWVQFTAPISHGSSGGALFNDRGEVVGITSAAFKDAQNLNLAINITEVLDLYNHWDGRLYEIKDAYWAVPPTPTPLPTPTPVPTAVPTPTPVLTQKPASTPSNTQTVPDVKGPQKLDIGGSASIAYSKSIGFAYAGNTQITDIIITKVSEDTVELEFVFSEHTKSEKIQFEGNSNSKRIFLIELSLSKNNNSVKQKMKIKKLLECSSISVTHFLKNDKANYSRYCLYHLDMRALKQMIQ